MMFDAVVVFFPHALVLLEIVHHIENDPHRMMFVGENGLSAICKHVTRHAYQ